MRKQMSEGYSEDKATRQKFTRLLCDLFDAIFHNYRDSIRSYLIAIGPLREKEAREIIQLQELKFYGVAGSGLLIVCASASQSNVGWSHIIASIFATLAIISAIYFALRLERTRTSATLINDVNYLLDSRDFLVSPLLSLAALYISFISVLSAISFIISILSIVFTYFAFKYFNAVSPPKQHNTDELSASIEAIFDFKSDHPDMNFSSQLRKLRLEVKNRVMGLLTR